MSKERQVNPSEFGDFLEKEIKREHHNFPLLTRRMILEVLDRLGRLPKSDGIWRVSSGIIPRPY